MKISYIGNTLSLVSNPMKGVPHTILRNYFKSKNIEITETFDGVYKDSDIIVFIISDGFDKSLYNLIKNTEDLDDKVLIGYSLELFETYNKKSIYEYFNYYSQYAFRKFFEYKINESIDLIISPGLGKLDKSIPQVYYPYFMAPSVFHEDKLTFILDTIRSKPKLKIESGKEDICMVYKTGHSIRDTISDEFDKSMLISYAGNYKKNDDRVPFTYDFDLITEYLSKFKFNIVIENEFYPGWITEKLINPLLGNCIPIYYDPFDNFPYDVINRDAVIILTDHNMIDVINTVLTYISSEEAFVTKFNDVPIFVEDAEILINKLMDVNFKILDSVL